MRKPKLRKVNPLPHEGIVCHAKELRLGPVASPRYRGRWEQWMDGLCGETVGGRGGFSFLQSPCSIFLLRSQNKACWWKRRSSECREAPAGSASTDWLYDWVFRHSNTFKDIFGYIRVSRVFTLLPMFAEQQGWEELGWVGDKCS